MAIFGILAILGIFGFFGPGPKNGIFGYFWKMGILAVSATVGENANFGKNGDFVENCENGENWGNQDLAKMSRSAKMADF